MTPETFDYKRYQDAIQNYTDYYTKSTSTSSSSSNM